MIKLRNESYKSFNRLADAGVFHQTDEDKTYGLVFASDEGNFNVTVRNLHRYFIGSSRFTSVDNSDYYDTSDTTPVKEGKAINDRYSISVFFKQVLTHRLLTVSETCTPNVFAEDCTKDPGEDIINTDDGGRNGFADLLRDINNIDNIEFVNQESNKHNNGLVDALRYGLMTFKIDKKRETPTTTKPFKPFDFSELCEALQSEVKEKESDAEQVKTAEERWEEVDFLRDLSEIALSIEQVINPTQKKRLWSTFEVAKEEGCLHTLRDLSEIALSIDKVVCPTRRKALWSAFEELT